jgi:hypothetical protein
MIKKLYIATILVLGWTEMSGQFYESGQDPSYIKWRQIVTDHIKIIYPADYEKKANRLANILEQARTPVSKSLDISTKRIPVILHTQSVESNGFVVLAPRRMELYTLPPQDIYSQDWLEQLGLHEFRHVAQMDKLNHGWTKIISCIAGQQVPGAVAGMTPRWFLEGDAVHSETSYSSSGRGRLPSFEMELRTMTMNNSKLFNYDKMLNGSYRDYVPDYYQYGYKMVAYGRYMYGNNLWEKVLDYTGSHPFRLVPFTLGLMKYSGRNKAELQKEAFSYYDSIWKDQDKKIMPTQYLLINKRSSNLYASYRFSQFLNDSMFIALKTGIDQLSQIILINKQGAEKKLLTTGPLDIVRLSMVNEILIWAEVRIDPRWDNRSYSIIRRLNVKTGIAKRLTEKTRYYAPSLSPDTKKIVTINISTDGESSIRVLDSENGSILNTIPAPIKGSLLIQPCWIDDSNIALILLNQEAKSIQMVNLINSKFTSLFEAGSYDITDLASKNGYLLFRGSFTGIDNLFTLSLTTCKVFQITSSRFGAYNPSFSGDAKKIIYSEYSNAGFNLAETNFDSSAWTPFRLIRNNFNATYNTVSQIENSQAWSLKSSDSLFISKPYRKVFNLFNFHSWLPFYYNYSQINLNNPTIYPGVTAISQNLLGTALTTLGYWYNQRNNYYQLDFTYKAWYPVFDFNIMYGGLPGYYDFNTKLVPSRVSDFTQTSMQIYLPLIYTLNSHYLQLYPSVQLIHDNDYLYSRIEQKYSRGKTYLHLDLLAYQFTSMSQRDFFPKFGQIIDFKYLSVPWNTEWFGSLYNFNSTIFLPGLMNHHSLQLAGAIEKQIVQAYLFDNLISLPTGLQDLIVSEQITFGSLSYSMPLIYPDFRIGPFFYLKRIRIKLFYEYANIQRAEFYNQSGLNNRIVTSTGGEILADFHLLRFFAPFIGGIKIYSLNENGRNAFQYQFLLQMDLGRL